MKNNKPETKQNTTAERKPKSQFLPFNVTFTASRVYSGDDAAPINEIQDVFAQSSTFVENIFAAIRIMNYGIESIRENDSDVLQTTYICESLALIGSVFIKQMQEQFDRLLQIAEENGGQKDE